MSKTKILRAMLYMLMPLAFVIYCFKRLEKHVKWFRPAIAYMVIFTVLFTSIPIDAFGIAVEASNVNGVIEESTEWDNNTAIKDIVISGGSEQAPIVITITGTIYSDDTILIAENSYVKFVGASDTAMMIRDENQDALVKVAASSTLVVENLIMDGGAVWTESFSEVLERGTTNSGKEVSDSLIDAGGQRSQGGTVVLGNGAILQNNDCEYSGAGGAVTIGEDGSLTINGALIRNNQNNSGNAGAVKMYAGSVLTFNSGEIYGNEASRHGGAIQIFGGDSSDYAHVTFHMTGGVIRNNLAGGVGGAIAISDYSDFHMTGGSIINNKTTDSSKRGGGIGFADSNTSMSISGNITILGNTAGNKANNLYIGTNSNNKLTVGDIAETATIGVYIASATANKVFSNGGADDVNMFSCDNDGYGVDVSGDNLKIVAGEDHANHPVCGICHTSVGDHTGSCENVSWEAWDGTGELEAGKNYYLSKDITFDNDYTISSDINLCLNGYTLDFGSGHLIMSDAAVNLCDCTGNGKIKGTVGSVIVVQEDAILNMYGGTISGNESAINNSGGKVVVAGGKIIGSVYGIYNGSNDGTIVVNGGVISGNTYGILNYAIFSLSGAPKITGNLADICSSENIGISGALTYTVPINVKKASSGIFTSGWAINMSDAVISDYFTLSDSGYVIVRDEASGELKKVKKYTLSFDANGGTGTKDVVSVVDGEIYALPENPFTAPSAYRFKGWATSASGSVITTETFTISSNNTLYAIWEKIPAEEPVVQTSDDLNLTYGKISSDSKVGVSVTTSNGYEITYQWYSNTEDSNTNGTLIADAVQTQYVILEGSEVGTYYYYCVVTATRTDNGETAVVTSLPIQVIVSENSFEDSEIIIEDYEGTYDGQQHSITVNIPVDATIGYRLSENESYSDSKPSFTDAGSYTIYYKISKVGYNDYTGSVTLTILPKKPTAPSLQAVDETIEGKADGKITGLTVEMEYSTSESGPYTKVTDAAMSFAPGTYYVRYAEKTNYIASDAVVVTIAAGRELDVTAPEISGITNGAICFGAVTFAAKDENLVSVKLDGTDITALLDRDGKYTITADDKEHSILVTDIDGNKIEVKVLVLKETAIQVEGFTGVYDGQLHSIQVTAPAGMNISYCTSEKESYVATNPGFADAGSYTVYYKISKEGYRDYTGFETVIITAKKQTAPSLQSVDETIEGKADGKITGLTIEMEYSTSESGTYTKVTDVAMSFAPGTYYVRYAEKTNYLASDAVVVTIVAGKKPESQNPGDYADTTPDTNVGGAQMDNTMEELKGNIPFTEEELDAVSKGSDVEIWLEVTEISATVPNEHKTMVEEKLGDNKLGMYLDVSLFKQVGEADAQKVTTLNGEITVSFMVPEELRNKDTSVTRTYKVIRVHDGVAEEIDIVYDAEKKTITFKTDRFSTYALTYLDEVENVPETPTPEVPPTPEVSTLPNTGEHNDFLLWIALLFIGGGFVLKGIKIKKVHENG